MGGGPGQAMGMGYDGGEAGRRIAAEDEYIRKELAETTAFCNAFWVSTLSLSLDLLAHPYRDIPLTTRMLPQGPGDRGFETVQARIRGANRTLDELRLAYRERAEIEAEYSKKLSKLAKSTLGKEESG